METPVKEWDFNPAEILASTRKVQGIFHQPVIDKDGEIISPKGMREAVPDFMHLPALHDFHKERPVGLATKVMELPGGRFYFEGVIKATSDCDDIWEKVKTGNYDQVSIFGKRTKYNNQCALPQNMRSGPCVTDGVRLDSISVCDENARNPQTSLEVKKAKTVFDAETIGKQWGRDKEGNFVEIKKANEVEKSVLDGKVRDPNEVRRTRSFRKYENDSDKSSSEPSYPGGKRPLTRHNAGYRGLARLSGSTSDLQDSKSTDDYYLHDETSNHRNKKMAKAESDEEVGKALEDRIPDKETGISHHQQAKNALKEKNIPKIAKLQNQIRAKDRFPWSKGSNAYGEGAGAEGLSVMSGGGQVKDIDSIVSRNYFDRGGMRKDRPFNKAESAGESNLMHESTDYAEEEDYKKGRRDRVAMYNHPVGVSAHQMAKEAKPGIEKIKAQIDVKDMRESDVVYQKYHGKEEHESAMEGMRNLHKSKKCTCPADSPNTIRKEIEKADGDDYDEDRPTVRYKGPSRKEKDSFMPMRERGEPVPKRTKSGYPLRVGKNVSPKSEKTPTGKGKPPAKDWVETGKRSQEAESHRDSAIEHGKKLLGKLGSKTVEGNRRSSQFKPGNTIKRQSNARVPKRGEEYLTSPYRKKEKGAAIASELASQASSRHEASISNYERKKKGENMEKGKRPTVTEEPADSGSTSQNTRKDVRERGEIRAPEMKFKKSEEVEKGAAEEAQEDMYEDDDYEHVKRTDKDGEWSKDKDPNGTVKMTKAQDNGKPEDSDDEEEEYDEEDDEEEVEKSRRTSGLNTTRTKRVSSENLRDGTGDLGRMSVSRLQSKYEDHANEHKRGFHRDIKKDDDEEVGKAIRFVDADEDDKKTYADHRRDEKPGKKKPKYEEEEVDKASSRPGDMMRGKQELSRRVKSGADDRYGPVETRGQADAAAHSQRKPYTSGKQFNKDSDRFLSSRIKKGDEDKASELFDPSTVTKGEQMDDYEDNDVEYVTKALVPIEEIDTIVKARTEEISKAYMGQLDEIKKAYDEKIVELSTKIDKMEQETIRKGGSVIVIPELMNHEGGSMSNADAIARMQAGQ